MSKVTGQCEHGTRVRRYGKSPKGKIWAAMFCPEKMCDPEWVSVTGILSEWVEDDRPWVAGPEAVDMPSHMPSLDDLRWHGLLPRTT